MIMKEEIQPDYISKTLIAPFAEGEYRLETVPLETWGDPVGTFEERIFKPGQIKLPEKPEYRSVEITVSRKTYGSLYRKYEDAWGLESDSKHVSLYYSPRDDGTVAQVIVTVNHEEGRLYVKKRSDSDDPEVIKNEVLQDIMEKMEHSANMIILCEEIDWKRGMEIHFGEGSFGACKEGEEVFTLPYGRMKLPIEKSPLFTNDNFAIDVVKYATEFMKAVSRELEKLGIVNPQEAEEEIALWVAQLYQTVMSKLEEKKSAETKP